MSSAIARLDLPAQTPASTSGKARDMLETSQRNLGFVPNMYANMANSPGLLQTYLQGYELFRNESGLSPTEQEVVFLTISRYNGCTYCTAAHSMIADKMSGVPADVLAALREGKPLNDAKLQALSAFAYIMVESRGTPTPEQLAAFKAVGYTDRHALEIILAIAVKTLSNYTNHVFHTQTDAAFQSYAWKPQV